MSEEVRRDAYGNKWYYNKEGQLHRLDGPAFEGSDGTKEWWQNGQRHRLDGPAIEYRDGSKAWRQNGQLHRLDGPALECSDGTRMEDYIAWMGLLLCCITELKGGGLTEKNIQKKNG